MPSLTDERYGIAAVDVLGDLHPSNRIRNLERTVNRLQRELAYNLRLPRGFNLNFPPDLEAAENGVDWDRQQRVRLTSEDETVTITNGTREDPSQIDLSVVAGCSVAYSQVEADTGSCVAVECNNVLTLLGGDCITTEVTACAAGDATVTISYTGNHWSDISGDTGAISATGCDDAMAIVGGTCIATVAAAGTPDTVTINFTGDFWDTVTADTGSLAADGCGDSMAIVGGTCIATSAAAGVLTIAYTGNHVSTFTSDTGTFSASGCNDHLHIYGGDCIETSVADDVLTISYTGNHYALIQGDSGTATADGCDDTLKIIGGACIATTVADGSPDTLIIDFSGSAWGQITTQDGSITPSSSGCSNTLEIEGDGSCTFVGIAAGKVKVSYIGAHFKTVTGNVGSAVADGCNDSLAIVGDGTYICTTAVDAADDTVTIGWCLPACTSPLSNPGSFAMGAPTGWAKIRLSPVGCGAECTTYAIPYWRCGPGG